MFIREEEVNILYDILLKELPDKVCGIYKITFPNGKVYIGQSNNIRRRMYEHNNINKQQVLKIRELFEHRDKEQTDRQNIIYIANLYNMSITSIYNIVHYKSYKDVKPVSTIPYVETQGSSTTIDT